MSIECVLDIIGEDNQFQLKLVMNRHQTLYELKKFVYEVK